MSSASDLLLARRYRLDDRIAAGGFGEVWRGTDTVLTRRVAIKLLQAGYAQHPETLARFRAEARHAGSLSHENIAHVYDYGEQEPPHPPFLVMELVDGPSLAGVLASGPLDPARAMDIVAQTAAGLQVAHLAGLVHRDIKPGNLLISRGDVVKITDFGISHAANSAPVTSTGMLVGTPAYLAPERVRGSRATPASDLYSLGVVAYQCLAGAPPFTGIAVEVALQHRDRPLPPLPSSVPPEVAALVTQLTAKDPAARPASAGEVSRRAGQLRNHLAPGAPALADYPLQAVGGQLAFAPGNSAATKEDQPAHAQANSAATKEDQPRHAQANLPATGDRLDYPPEYPPAEADGQPGPGPGCWPATGDRLDLAAGIPPATAGERPTRVLRPGPRRPASGRAGRRVAVGAAVIAAGLIGLLLTGVFSPGTSHAPALSPAGRSTGGSSPAASMISVNAGSLAGQPVSAAVRQLRQLGLGVRVLWRRSGQQPPGTVLSVTPGGRVPAGSLVTVTGALQADQGNGPPDHGGKPGGPGKDHGNGHGHGNGGD
jgi:serine/threonine-protein kinase